MNTYFEIGGHVIENHVVEQGHPGRPQQLNAKTIGKQFNVPAPLVKAASKEAEEKLGIDPMLVADSYARVRRAKWAITTAATLAAADGPLPIGDALAIGVLGGYATYEVFTAISQHF